MEEYFPFRRDRLTVLLRTRCLADAALSGLKDGPMALQRLTALALTGALALGVAGCGDDPSKPSASTSTATASASPSSTGPAAPVMPELAKRNDAVGAKAFVRYWFDLANFAIGTGDATAVESASSSSCASCANLMKAVEHAYASGGRIRGGHLHVLGLEHDPRLKAPLYRFALRLEQKPKQEVDADGEVTKRERRSEALFFGAVKRVGDHYEFLGLERIDD